MTFEDGQEVGGAYLHTIKSFTHTLHYYPYDKYIHIYHTRIQML